MIEKSPKEVVVKFDHLPPRLMQFIKAPFFDDNISTQRKIRAVHEIFMGITGLAPFFSENRFMGPLMIGLDRQFAIYSIQKLHQRLMEEMNLYGVVSSSFERDYEKKFGVDRLTPASIGKNRPIFYVKGNGDVVFVPQSRMEYARYKFQQLKAAKLGINPWRWRVYLRPPEAPQSVKEWASQQANKWAQEIRAGLKGRQIGFSRTMVARNKLPKRPVFRPRHQH